MKAANHSMDVLDTREFLGLANRVNRSRVSATGEDDQPFVLHIDHHGLIIMNIGVLLPLIAPERIVQGKAGFKVRCTMHLSSHKHEITEHIRRTTLLNEVDAIVRENLTIWWRQINLMTVGKNHFSF